MTDGPATAGRFVALALRLTAVRGPARPRRRASDGPMACRQCGASEPVHVLRRGRRHTRYWCERCGAVDRIARSGKPLNVTGVHIGDSPDLVPSDLTRVMPPAMVRWVVDTGLHLPPLDRLGRRALYDLYRRWDRETGASGPDFAAVPDFADVIDALHDACYRRDVAQRLLGPPSPALMERVAHAHRWLALRANDFCWIVRRLPDGELARPEPATVRRALDEVRIGATPDAGTVRTIVATVFGTYAGPSWERLSTAYPPAEIAAALLTYLEDGGRPLRTRVLADLTTDEGLRVL